MRRATREFSEQLSKKRDGQLSHHATYKHAPVVVQLYEGEVHKADLLRELRIDRHQIDREILKQPGKYAWWGALHSEVAAKVERLEIELDHLYSKLYVLYTNSRDKKTRMRVTEVKHLIEVNSMYHKLRKKLWRWRKSERFLKHAVRAFDQRLYALQSRAADQRRERIQA